MAHNPLPFCRQRKASKATHHEAWAPATDTALYACIVPLEAEHRHEERFAQQVKITFCGLAPSADSLRISLEGQTTNMSAGGACLATKWPLTPLSCIRCEIELPNTAMAVPTLMQVRWVKQMDDDCYQSGLMFLV